MPDQKRYRAWRMDQGVKVYAEEVEIDGLVWFTPNPDEAMPLTESLRQWFIDREQRIPSGVQIEEY